jgi:UDP-N-acetyl-D-glucosamine/UDP-N-acetyl-D-galactosamine dehydrogenase
MENNLMEAEVKTIAVVGLGYVGLPLAAEFGKTRKVIGFDTNINRIADLQSGLDQTRELDADDLATASHLTYTNDINDLSEAQIFIITVPTPIDESKRPDLSPLVKASRAVGSVLDLGDIVVYESTVYPGATEEVCVPVLEQVSGLKFNKDFFCGYSPERINPGDNERRLPNIVKVTSGSTPSVADEVDQLYGSIILAGTHKAASIRVAEAAKVIENTQRDLNIALVNELAKIFNKMSIDTEAVLRAAGTKWNFLPFRPGLVGGHCIGVDPYYLTHKAEQIGYNPQVILSGRRINDGMGAYVANTFMKMAAKRGILSDNMRVLILGLAFKENCPDLRNTRVVDVIRELSDFGVEVDVCDPQVSTEEAHKEYGIKILDLEEVGVYDGIILAVPHKEFASLSAKELRSLGCPGAHIFYDLKSIFDENESDIRL